MKNLSSQKEEKSLILRLRSETGQFRIQVYQNSTLSKLGEEVLKLLKQKSSLLVVQFGISSWISLDGSL